MSTPVTSTWHLIVPVKSRFRAKSRLQPPAGIARPDLAFALAMDTLSVALEVVRADRIIVVTEDDQITHEMQQREVTVVPDPGRGLNAAVQVGLNEATRRAPGLAAAVLLGDLPTLKASELCAGLRACAANESALVPDHDGSGTVLLTHHDAAALAPRFGRGSAARHARNCAVLELDLPTLRRDVDDAAALEIAISMGVGPWSTKVLGSPAQESA